MDPYRHVDVVRVEECASCESRKRRSGLVWRKVVAGTQHLPFAVTLLALFVMTTQRFPNANLAPWWAQVYGFGSMLGVLVQAGRAVVAAVEAK